MFLISGYILPCLNLLLPKPAPGGEGNTIKIRNLATFLYEIGSWLEVRRRELGSNRIDLLCLYLVFSLLFVLQN